jgi:hypothetical protein
VLAAFLEPIAVNVSDPFLPVSAPANARPYPRSTGGLWGWGAENCDSRSATSDALLNALSQPQCALAGANNSVEGIIAVYTEMRSTLVQYEAAGDVLSKTSQAFPSGIETELRRQLSLTKI